MSSTDSPQTALHIRSLAPRLLPPPLARSRLQGITDLRCPTFAWRKPPPVRTASDSESRSSFESLRTSGCECSPSRTVNDRLFYRGRILWARGQYEQRFLGFARYDAAMRPAVSRPSCSPVFPFPCSLCSSSEQLLARQRRTLGSALSLPRRCRGSSGCRRRSRRRR